jgi:hypothetical protein
MPKIPIAATAPAGTVTGRFSCASTNTASAGTVTGRFSCASTLDGYEVIDADGRCVTDSYVHYGSATKAAARLNDAAEGGPKALRMALGAVEDTDYDDLILTADELEALGDDYL